ncbi:hypothetical protein BGZ60DRAFT_528730 [Tricladium varicosporioides]|nr:hypothetical protein BGZ60DRAFT_528730 [Hymenoscyphus varicosporioides]
MTPTKKSKSSDPTRAERKAKKRKLEDAIPDLPGEENKDGEELSGGDEGKKRRKRIKNDEELEAPVEETGKQRGRREKKERKQAERTEKEKQDGATEKVEEKEDVKMRGVGTTANEEGAPRKSKKERKAERKAKEAAEAAVATEAAKSTSNGDNKDEGAKEKKSKKNNRNREKKRKGLVTGASDTAVEGEDKEKKSARFICFIGNLPFSATQQSLQKHFASVKPKSIRALTQKDDPTKSKGCAFIEFDGYDHMKTCLKLLHHSVFDDGISPARKINVELTAGGGGNTKDRRAKIEQKNSKLNEERVRKIQEEEKAKWAKKAEAGGVDESAIHPSRRRFVPVA